MSQSAQSDDGGGRQVAMSSAHYTCRSVSVADSMQRRLGDRCPIFVEIYKYVQSWKQR